MRLLSLTLLALLVTACAGERGNPPATSPADTAPVADTAAGAEPPVQPAADWPPEEGRPIDLARQRSVDLTGDGRPETVRVTARGPRYDSLAVALTITAAAGDTLWRDTWSSLLYFVYDPLEGKADSTVSRIVRAHVDSLLSDDRFSERGMPARLSQGTGVDDMMRESVRYHLAELDWRRSADLSPADETPPDAHSSIDARQIPAQRVDALVRELRAGPAFWYFAGGEATYAIGWSDSEEAFVRMFACC